MLAHLVPKRRGRRHRCHPTTPARATIRAWSDDGLPAASSRRSHAAVPLPVRPVVLPRHHRQQRMRQPGRRPIGRVVLHHLGRRLPARERTIGDAALHVLPCVSVPRAAVHLATATTVNASASASPARVLRQVRVRFGRRLRRRRPWRRIWPLLPRFRLHRLWPTLAAAAAVPTHLAASTHPAGAAATTVRTACATCVAAVSLRFIRTDRTSGHRGPSCAARLRGCCLPLRPPAHQAANE